MVEKLNCHHKKQMFYVQYYLTFFDVTKQVMNKIFCKSDINKLTT